MNDFYIWIGGIIFSILGAFGLYIKGRRDGAVKSAAENMQEVIKELEKQNETIDKVNEVKDDVASTSGNDVQQRLREKYSRD